MAWIEDVWNENNKWWKLLLFFLAQILKDPLLKLGRNPTILAETFHDFLIQLRIGYYFK
jgi:hypothetical protein